MSERDGSSSRLLSSVLWMAWSGLISIANSLLLWAFYARMRETAELGQFTIVMGLYMIFVTVCTLGLGPYLSGETARLKSRSPDSISGFTASAVSFLLGWSVVCAGLMTAAGFAASASAEVRKACAILSLAMLPTGLIAVAEPVSTALGRTRLIALVSTIENLLRTIIPLFLLITGRGLTSICISFVAVRVVAAAIYILAARDYLSGIWRVSRDGLREIAGRAPTFAGVTILAALHFQLAAVLLGRLGSETDAAEFGAASRFLIPVLVLMGSYGSVLQPAASRIATESMRSLGEFIARQLRIVTALALPCALGASMLSREALVLLFGEKLISAAPSLELLALTIVPLCAVIVLARGLVATGNQRIDLAGNLCAVGVNLLLNLVLIPRFGASGAAAAQLVSATVLALVPAVFTTRRLYRLEFSKTALACAAPLVLMMLVIWQVRSLGFWSAVLAGSFVYLAGALMIEPELRPAFIIRTQ